MSGKKPKFGDTALGAWMRAHPEIAGTHGGFAEFFGLSRTYLTELLGGAKTPGGRTIVTIHRKTGGAVSVEDWPGLETVAPAEPENGHAA